MATARQTQIKKWWTGFAIGYLLAMVFAYAGYLKYIKKENQNSTL